jgi:flagellar protein FliO/FliZ
MNCRRAILVLLVGGLLGCAPRLMLAADKPTVAAEPGGIIYPSSATTRAEAAAGHGSGYNAVLGLAFVLAVAGGWLFWRGRTSPRGTLAVRKLAIAETKSLGNRQYLVVASYDDRKYLLGVCPGRIELLTPLEATPPAKSP